MTKAPVRLVVLISGRGSNLVAIARACHTGQLPSAQIVGIVSSRTDAGGLHLDEVRDIPHSVLRPQDYADRVAYDAALSAEIDRYAPDWIVLAGFMRQLTPEFVERYLGRLINIHPSLLPLFPGLHTHRRALEAGLRWHGATVHFVTPELDAGPIIAQGVVPVAVDDTEDRLAKRVLALEHELYPRALAWLLAGQVRLAAGKAEWLTPPPCGEADGVLISPKGI